MKSAILLLALVLSIGQGFAQSVLEATSATTLSPFATATKLLESATVTMISPFATTLASAQARGVAGKEQLKDELVALNQDMVAGKVKSIEEVRQPALRELLEEIAADEKQMEEINALISAGSKLHRVATAVTVALMME
jgi:hypothetical protein